VDHSIRPTGCERRCPLLYHAGIDHRLCLSSSWTVRLPVAELQQMWLANTMPQTWDGLPTWPCPPNHPAGLTARCTTLSWTWSTPSDARARTAPCIVAPRVHILDGGSREPGRTEEPRGAAVIVLGHTLGGTRAAARLARDQESDGTSQLLGRDGRTDPTRLPGRAPVARGRTCSRQGQSSPDADRVFKHTFLPPRCRRLAPGLRSATSCRAPVRRCWAPGAGGCGNARENRANDTTRNCMRRQGHQRTVPRQSAGNALKPKKSAHVMGLYRNGRITC
jgi:hypothetical protein